MVWQRYSQGEVVFSEGESGDRAFVIEEGEIEVSTVEHGRRVVLGRLGPGALLGEMAIIDHAPRTATATAVIPSVLSIITREQITDRLNQADPLVRLLMSLVTRRYRTGLNQVKGGEGAEVQPLLLDAGDDHELAIDKLRLENELREALAGGGLEIHYQPLLHIPSRAWSGFEALTRWTHPRRGVVHPDRFIALAEETDLIVPVGLFVLETACRQLKRLQQARDQARPGLPPLFVGVNVAIRQISEPGFIDQVAEAARRADVSPEYVKLEITENLLTDYEGVADWIRQARSRGFRVALDDFGVGHSSFAHLLKLEFDIMKIDQSFVRAMGQSHKALEIVRGIVALGHGLGMEIVAEGVETESELLQLDALDVRYAQGFLIGKAMDAERVLVQLRQGV